MSRLSLTLIIILVLSIGFNLALWYGGKSSDNTTQVITEAKDESNAQAETPEEQLESANQRPELDVEPLRRLLQNGEFIELGRRLQDALRVLPDNLELLLMEAEFIVKTEPLSDAILNYYDLLDRSLETKSKVLIRSRIDNLTTMAINRFQKTHQWDLLAQLLEPLFQRRPQNRYYILSLAEAYGQQRNFSLMESVLASLNSDDPEALKLKENMYANRQSNIAKGSPYYYDDEESGSDSDEANKESVGLVRSGDQYLVDLFVEDTPVRMLIDTGASMTALSGRTFDRLSDDYRSEFLGVFQVNTAGGVIEAPMVSFSQVKLGKYIFHDLSIVVIPTDPFDEAEGLLGMNILRAFDFRIDQKAPALVLDEL